MKIINYIVALVFLLVSFTSYGQGTYYKTYGDVEYKVFTDVAASTNNDLVTAGYWTPSVSITPVQPFLTRVDDAGNLLWSKEYASAGIGRAASISTTSDGGFLVTGKIDTIIGTGGSDDGYVLKVNGNGIVQWMTIVGAVENEEFKRVYEAPNGEIIAIGTYSVQATSDEYFWFVRMSATGNVINSFVYFPTANAEAQTLAFHPDGGYVIGGIGRVNFIDEAYLFKISAVGALEWYKSYGAFGGSENIHDMVLLDDNSVVFVGTRYQANRDIFIAKTDSIGQLLWFKDYGGPDHDEAYRIINHNSGGYVVGGWTEALGGVKGTMLFKTDTNGNLEWTHVIGDGLPTGSVGIVQLPNTKLAIVGTVLPDQSTAIGVIAQVNSNGTGCNYTAVTLPSIMVTTTVSTPVVYASLGPSSSKSYNPIVSDVILMANTDC
ncbi:MAG: hypothetical protein GY751_09000, partial [Bacteroidetes bacterium]|nr:hypothetical protein [Bacteroidota bacterium]